MIAFKNFCFNIYNNKIMLENEMATIWGQPSFVQVFCTMLFTEQETPAHSLVDRRDYLGWQPSSSAHDTKHYATVLVATQNQLHISYHQTSPYASTNSKSKGTPWYFDSITLTKSLTHDICVSENRRYRCKWRPTGCNYFGLFIHS